MMFASPPLVQVEKVVESIFTVKDVVEVTLWITPRRVLICVMPLTPLNVTVVTPTSADVKACVAVILALTALLMPVIVRCVEVAPGGNPVRGTHSEPRGV